MALAGALFAMGVTADIWLLITWLRSQLHLTAMSFPGVGVLGLLLIILGFETFAFTLILHMIVGTDRASRGNSENET